VPLGEADNRNILPFLICGRPHESADAKATCKALFLQIRTVGNYPIIEARNHVGVVVYGY
jgi:hypothetical protein